MKLFEFLTSSLRFYLKNIFGPIIGVDTQVEKNSGANNLIDPVKL